MTKENSHLAPGCALSGVVRLDAFARNDESRGRVVQLTSSNTFR
jgi:hypothetical protein